LIRGVSVITEGEAQGHGVFIDSKTLETTLSAAKQFPGGVKCKMDHGSGLPDIVGTFSNFRVEGAKLRADLQLLLTHPRYQSLMELARRAPTASGMSISFKYTPEVIRIRNSSASRNYIQSIGLMVRRRIRPACSPVQGCLL
jgi:hypothetical protein